jgi:hypothetical protein
MQQGKGYGYAECTQTETEKPLHLRLAKSEWAISRLYRVKSADRTDGEQGHPDQLCREGLVVLQ